MTTTFQPPHADALAEAERVKPLLAHFFGTAVSVAGHITRNGIPVGAAKIEVTELQYSNGETRHADGRYGRYALWLPDGTWTLRFSAPGLSSQTQQVTVSEGATVTLDVTL